MLVNIKKGGVCLLYLFRKLYCWVGRRHRDNSRVSALSILNYMQKLLFGQGPPELGRGGNLCNVMSDMGKTEPDTTVKAIVLHWSD